MAETSKNLLYLLPDVAYSVELSRSKESEAFTIRDYLQINGTFMDENDILEESVKKLLSRIRPEEYDLILPDFLFTNTIVSVAESGTEKVLNSVRNGIIPDLGISDETHEIHSFVLTEFKGQARVQLSALEKSVLKPLQGLFGSNSGASIRKIYPLSWTTKSLISLEPSISVMQLGANLYLAQHYIGIDQTNSAEIEDAEKLVETIKTLKGAESSIQTVYLLSNALVEEKLTTGLKGVLPVQQLAKEQEDSEMPSYVKQCIEAAIKTLAVPEYNAPAFSFMIGDVIDEVIASQAEQDAALPVPTEIGVEKGDEEPIQSTSKTADDEKQDEQENLTPTVEVQSPLPPAAAVPLAAEEEKPAPNVPEASQDAAEILVSEKIQPADDGKQDETEISPATEETLQNVFQKQPEPVKEEVKESVVALESTQESDYTVQPEKVEKKKVIKNDTGVSSMVKMVFVGLVSFFITVGIGLGIGLGFLTFTNKQAGSEDMPTPVAQVSPTVAPTATPTPEPIDRASYSVLVVNATTKAGYAGRTTTSLKEAGFQKVTAQNAKGDYEEGSFVLMEEENPSLISLLSQDIDLTLAFMDGKEVEDPSGQYDIVIVLAE